MICEFIMSLPTRLAEITFMVARVRIYQYYNIGHDNLCDVVGTGTAPILSYSTG